MRRATPWFRVHPPIQDLGIFEEMCQFDAEMSVGDVGLVTAAGNGIQRKIRSEWLSRRGGECLCGEKVIPDASLARWGKAAALGNCLPTCWWKTRGRRGSPDSVARPLNWPA